jgi:RNA polymerase sigma factor (sigma-70 family)
MEKTLKDFTNLAIYFIKKYCYGPTLKVVLSDNEHIGFVVSELTKANERYNGMGQLNGYLDYCASGIIKTLVKKISNKQQLLSLDSQFLGNTLYTTINDSHAKSPQEILINRERNQTLYSAVEKLSKAQRLCVQLVYFDGLSCAKAAKELGVSRQAVNVNIRNGIKSLKNILIGEIDELS